MLRGDYEKKHAAYAAACGMQGERHKGRNVRVPQPGECGAGHISAIGGWDDIPAQVWCFKQDGSELVRDRNDPGCGLCFEIIVTT